MEQMGNHSVSDCGPIHPETLIWGWRLALFQQYYVIAVLTEHETKEVIENIFCNFLAKEEAQR